MLTANREPPENQPTATRMPHLILLLQLYTIYFGLKTFTISRLKTDCRMPRMNMMPVALNIYLHTTRRLFVVYEAMSACAQQTFTVIRVTAFDVIVALK